MPDVNLLQDTESPEEQAKKPRPQPEFEVSDPGQNKGMGGFFKSILGRPKAPNDPSRMGLGKSKSDQRILSETRTVRPNVIPLPEADEEGGLGVNLLSEDLLNRSKPREQLIKLGLIALGAAVFVGLVYGGLIFAQRSVTTQISSTRAELDRVQAETASLRAKQATVQQTVQKISAIRGLIDRHIRWTKFFSLMEKYTLDTVSYGTSFIGDIGGNLTLSAKTDSYEQVAKQYLVYQQAVARQELISDFSITGAAKSRTATGGDQVTFAVTMNIFPSAFENTAPSAEEQLSLIPNISQLGVFADYLAGLCYLRGQPGDLVLVPSAVRSDFQSAIGQLTENTCTEFTADDLDRARRLLGTDADGDGLSQMFEQLIETSDQNADTDSDGQDDLAEFLAVVNSPTQ